MKAMTLGLTVSCAMAVTAAAQTQTSTGSMRGAATTSTITGCVERDIAVGAGTSGPASGSMQSTFKLTHVDEKGLTAAAANAASKGTSSAGNGVSKDGKGSAEKMTSQNADRLMSEIQLTADSRVDLSKYVGQRIEATGTLSGSSTVSPTSPSANVNNNGVPPTDVSSTATGSAGTGNVGPGVSGVSNNGKNVATEKAQGAGSTMALSVTSVRMVASSCK